MSVLVSPRPYWHRVSVIVVVVVAVQGQRATKNRVFDCLSPVADQDCPSPLLFFGYRSARKQEQGRVLGSLQKVK